MSLTHKELLSLHDKAYNYGYDTRLKAADDTLFAWISQWDSTYLSESDLGYRGEFNILRKAMRQITTDLISNPVSIDFDPVEGTCESGAEIIDGMYRADMRNNTALEAKKNANQETIVCGVGAWELRSEYKNNFGCDERQVIRRHPLYEANNNIMWDPNAKLIDKSDANYVSCLVSYSEDGFKDLVLELTGEEADGYDSSFSYPEMSYVFPWISETNKVFVTRFFHRERKKVKYLTFVDMFGTEKTIKKSEFKEHEEDIIEHGFNLKSEKTIDRYVITRYIASGDRILDETIIAGEHIPIIPQYGERAFVEGEEHYEGIVRLAKDPQRLRNFQMSYLADIVSRSPREKPIFTQEQIQGYEDMYEDSGSENNYPYLKQNTYDANGNLLPVGAVGYIKAPEVPPALMMSMGETRAAVDDVAGAGLPADITDVDLSGKALNALNKRLDMQSYTYQDNHKFAMRRDGEVYASMARDVYDSEQEIVLVKADNSKMSEKINASMMNFETMEPEVKNNLSNMVFDVYADIAPSFESVKAQNKEELKELLSSGTLDQETHTILLNEYLIMVDGVAFKDLRDYSRKKLIAMGVKSPETQEEKEDFAKQQEQQQTKQDPMMIAAQAEATKAQADMLAQQNKQVELQIQMDRLQSDAGAKQEKLNSETQLNIAKIDQEQQKINNDARDKQVKTALEMSKLELEIGRDMNASVIDNMLVFDPAVGDFV